MAGAMGPGTITVIPITATGTIAAEIAVGMAVGTIGVITETAMGTGTVVIIDLIKSALSELF
jgi:hypothetical protein